MGDQVGPVAFLETGLFKRRKFQNYSRKMTSMHIQFRHTEESNLRPGKERQQNLGEDEEMKSSISEQLGESSKDIEEVENDSKTQETVKD